MSTSTRLLVLGVVRLFQPVHGYEVRRELVTWRASEWASVNPGSIYNALKTLTRDGLLEVVGTDQVGGRPERTTYQLTAAGEEEFRGLLHGHWWTVASLTDPMVAAVSFLGAISRKEAIAALEHRIAQIQGMARHVEFVIENHDGKESPYHVREMMRLMNARNLAEIGWAEQFLVRLRNGEYHTADDPPWLPLSANKHEAGKRGKRRAFRAEQRAAVAATASARARAAIDPSQPAPAERDLASAATRKPRRAAKPAGASTRAASPSRKRAASPPAGKRAAAPPRRKRTASPSSRR